MEETYFSEIFVNFFQTTWSFVSVAAQIPKYMKLESPYPANGSELFHGFSANHEILKGL
jgi:hypothetical protein